MSTHTLPRLPALSADVARVRIAAVALAALTLGARFLAALVTNAPAGPTVVRTPTLATVAAATAALAAVVVGATADRPAVGVGCLFVGVFGALSLVADAAALPAAVAVTAGTAVAVVGSRERLGRRDLAVVGLLVPALALALLGGVGAVVSVRGPASAVTLVGLGTLPALAAADGRALLGGGLAFGAVLAVGFGAPFLTGAVTLVGGGVVGASLPLVALAVAGVVTTASAAGRTGQWPLLLGVGLVAFSGVPATLARAVPFALGLLSMTSMGGDP